MNVYRNLFIWLIIGVMMILLFNLFSAPKKTEQEIIFSDFMTRSLKCISKFSKIFLILGRESASMINSGVLNSTLNIFSKLGIKSLLISAIFLRR